MTLICRKTGEYSAMCNTIFPLENRASCYSFSSVYADTNRESCKKRILIIFCSSRYKTSSVQKTEQFILDFPRADGKRLLYLSNLLSFLCHCGNMKGHAVGAPLTRRWLPSPALSFWILSSFLPIPRQWSLWGTGGHPLAHLLKLSPLEALGHQCMQSRGSKCPECGLRWGTLGERTLGLAISPFGGAAPQGHFNRQQVQDRLSWV